MTPGTARAPDGSTGEPELVSVLVPTWREAPRIAACLASILDNEPPLEVIVCDARSDDGTADIARGFGAVRVIDAPRRGRAAQMNEAANRSRGAVLWFVHADCRVPTRGARRIREALHDARIVGGSFRFAVDSPRRVFRALERAVRLRTRWLGAPYGDQALFVRRATFEAVGGYVDEPLLEDLRLVRALRRAGRLAAVEDPVVTSARRWEERGFLRTTARHLAVLALEKLGASASTLHRVRNG